MSNVMFAGMRFNRLNIPNDRDIIVVFSTSSAYRDLGEMQLGCHAQFSDGSPYALGADDFRALETDVLSFLDREYANVRRPIEGSPSVVFDTRNNAVYACLTTKSVYDLSRPLIASITPITSCAPSCSSRQIEQYQNIIGDIENQTVGTKIILPLHPHNCIVWREASRSRLLPELSDIHFDVDISADKIRMRHHAHFMQSHIPFRDVWESAGAALRNRIKADLVSGRKYGGSYSFTVRTYPSCSQYELYPATLPIWEIVI